MFFLNNLYVCTFIVIKIWQNSQFANLTFSHALTGHLFCKWSKDRGNTHSQLLSGLSDARMVSMQINRYVLKQPRFTDQATVP